MNGIQSVGNNLKNQPPVVVETIPKNVQRLSFKVSVDGDNRYAPPAAHIQLRQRLIHPAFGHRNLRQRVITANVDQIHQMRVSEGISLASTVPAHPWRKRGWNYLACLLTAPYLCACLLAAVLLPAALVLAHAPVGLLYCH